jgi:pre-rRNA-processing protein IPI3
MTVVAASPCGRFISAGGLSGKLYIWDVLSGELLRSWDGHYKLVSAIVFSPCGSAIVSGGHDGMIHVWSLPSCIDIAAASDLTVSPDPLMTWTEHHLPVTALKFGSGIGFACKLFSASVDQSIKIWQLTLSSSIHTLHFPAAVSCVDVDGLETRVFAGCDDGSVYQVIIGASLASSSVGSHASFFSAPADLSDSREVKLQAIAESAQVTGPLIQSSFLGHSGAITCMAISGDNSKLITGGVDQSVRIWDINSRQQISSCDFHSSPVLTLCTMEKPAVFVHPGLRRSGAFIQSVQPLKKHQLPVPVDWIGSTTGVLSDVHPIVCRPSTWLTEEVTEVNMALQRSIGTLFALLQAADNVPVKAAELAAPHEDTAALTARIAQLESENNRWKEVNNKLLARLQGNTEVAADIPVVGAKRRRGDDD